MAELKPCPFCGSKWVQVRWIGFKNAKPSGFHPGLYAECTDCFAMKGPYANKEDAEYAWNSRAEYAWNSRAEYAWNSRAELRENTADVAGVVHCMDCINWNGNDCTSLRGLFAPKPDDYCSRGIDNG